MRKRKYQRCKGDLSPWNKEFALKITMTVNRVFVEKCAKIKKYNNYENKNIYKNLY